MSCHSFVWDNNTLITRAKALTIKLDIEDGASPITEAFVANMHFLESPYQEGLSFGLWGSRSLRLGYNIIVRRA